MSLAKYTGPLLQRANLADHSVSVYENETHRWMKFDGDEIQSVLTKKNPDFLTLPYLQGMALVNGLLTRDSEKALLLGLGAGSLSKFLQKAYPTQSQVTVEISPVVADFARRYFAWQEREEDVFVLQDALEYVQQSSERFDLIYVDLFDAAGASPLYRFKGFIRLLNQRLRERSWVVFNLLPHDSLNFTALLKRIREVFARRVLCINISGYDNVIVFAANYDYTRQNAQRSLAECERIIKSFEFSFQVFVERLDYVNANDPSYRQWVKNTDYKEN